MSGEYDVTSVGVNPIADRSHRMRIYFIAMTLRVACVASFFFVRGWWILVVGVAAIVLPYFAVLIANQAENRPGLQPEAPRPVELEGPTSSTPENAAADTVIVVDAPAERRATGDAA